MSKKNTDKHPPLTKSSSEPKLPSQGGDFLPPSPVDIIPIANFNRSGAQNSGGMTGSQMVPLRLENVNGETTSIPCQLKPSILKNDSKKRQIKARYLDHENFGEVIASHITSYVSGSNGDQNFRSVPEVFLVYDNGKENKEKFFNSAPNPSILVASKYLSGDPGKGNVRTLDDYAKENGMPRNIKHAKFVDSSKSSAADISVGEFDISGEENKQLRKDIARNLALSMLVGDHDVNPGNMMAITVGGVVRVARIDFGHAFFDLISAPKVLGGQILHEENHIIDFINRQNVANFPTPGESKLWRDYPGMVPSAELADAMAEVADSKEVKAGIQSAKSAFMNLFYKLEQAGDQKSIDHLLQSLDKINQNIGGEPIRAPNSVESLNQVFANIETFCEKNQEHMKKAAKLMKLQAEIDKQILKNLGHPEQPIVLPPELKDIHQNLIRQGGIKGSKIQWMRTSPEGLELDCSIEEYIVNRKQEIQQAKNQTVAEKKEKAMPDLPSELSSLPTTSSTKQPSRRHSADASLPVQIGAPDSTPSTGSPVTKKGPSLSK